MLSHIRFKSCDWFVLPVELVGCWEHMWIITIDFNSLLLCLTEATTRPTEFVERTCSNNRTRWRPGARWRNYAESTARLHSNWALEQFEDTNGNIMGSARLFVTVREAEYIHTESAAMTTLANHVLYSCTHTLQPASFSTTKALNGGVLKWHFSLSRPASANRQINVKPKERCYFNTANNQVIASTI